MAKSSSIYTRVDPDIKKQAEDILGQLGISMSNAVEMFLRQVAIHRGMPFELKLPSAHPADVSLMTKEEFDRF